MMLLFATSYGELNCILLLAWVEEVTTIAEC